MKKRTWHYLLKPAEYEVFCNNGGRINKKHKTEWSEYEHKIWCYDCKKDMDGFPGIFGGPIPYEATLMMMGPYCFHRYNIKRKVIEKPIQTKPGGRFYYRVDKEATKKFIKMV